MRPPSLYHLLVLTMNVLPLELGTISRMYPDVLPYGLVILGSEFLHSMVPSLPPPFKVDVHESVINRIQSYKYCPFWTPPLKVDVSESVTTRNQPYRYYQFWTQKPLRLKKHIY